MFVIFVWHRYNHYCVEYAVKNIIWIWSLSKFHWKRINRFWDNRDDGHNVSFISWNYWLSPIKSQIAGLIIGFHPYNPNYRDGWLGVTHIILIIGMNDWLSPMQPHLLHSHPSYNLIRFVSLHQWSDATHFIVLYCIRKISSMLYV